MDPSKCPKNGQKASVLGDFLGSDGKPPNNGLGVSDTMTPGHMIIGTR